MFIVAYFAPFYQKKVKIVILLTGLFYYMDFDLKLL